MPDTPRSRPEKAAGRLAAPRRGNPDRNRFREQRERAAQRGIEWKLEYWEWLQIWQDSGHYHERGRCAGQWVMGRNGDTGAYEASNVKIIRVEKNNTDANYNRRRVAA